MTNESKYTVCSKTENINKLRKALDFFYDSWFLINVSNYWYFTENYVLS